MNPDEAVAASNPYPRQRIDALPLDAASQDLMGEIMATPTSTPTAPQRTREPGRRARWIAPIAAAAAVTAVVAGGVALNGGEDDPAGPSTQSPSAGTPTSAPTTGQPPAVPDTTDPGLPPTSDNLHQIVLHQDGWTIANMDDSETGGSLSWQKGSDSFQVTWYPSESYDSYLTDRRADGPGKKAEILGQVGEAFTTKIPAVPDSGTPTHQATVESSDPTDLASSTLVGGDETEKGVRVMTILPAVGEWFLEFDAFVGSQAAYDDLVASLSRLDRKTWLAAIEEGVVTPAEGDGFLAEAGKGVPLPDGLTVTTKDLRLPQSGYQARATFVAKVVCGWAEQYVDGDDAALTALQGSDDWQVLQDMKPEGEYPSVVRENVQQLAKDRTHDGWRAGWGC